jgi:aryl-alcohol dehydrogenase-like predicted oxidoreductase
MGFGAMSITAYYGRPMADIQALALLKFAYESGCNHYDTSEVYKTLDVLMDEPESEYNETILGKHFATLPRRSFTVGTKFFPGRMGRGCDDGSVMQAFTASLARMKLDYIDIYYLHRMPRTIEELEQWMYATKKLVLQGKIRFIGLSEVSPSWLRRAHAIHPIACIQMEWSMATRIVEDELVFVCKELGIGIIASSPLCRNLLLLGDPKDKAPQDWRAAHPRYQGSNFEVNKEMARKVSAIATRLGLTSAQLCLAWLYRRAKELDVPMIAIPGTRQLDHLRSNLRALNVELSDADYKELSWIGQGIKGPRADESYLALALEGQLMKERVS